MTISIERLAAELVLAEEELTGKAATQILEPGERVNLSVVGVQGPPGDKGDQGEVGPQGETGAAGERGEGGPIGPEGPAGPKGDPGRDGRDGLDGKAGAAGPKGDRGEPGASIKGPPGPQGPAGVSMGRGGLGAFRGGPGLSDTTPLIESGSGAPGTAGTASRGDHVHPAGALAGISAANTPFTPNGSIAATDVQAAIQEVRDEAGAGGAPTDVDYLVGTASGGLSAEIVVGASPGGELGGTWASPTVDASHSGSTHAATQAAAEATAAGALATHEADTTAIHGIANTANLYAAGGTDVAVADGGTGASTASGARTNLGLAIGTDVPGQAAFDDHSARHDAGGADVMAIDAAQATGSLRTITTSAAQAVGTAAAGNGTAAASSNHVHSTGAGTPSTQAFGDAAATGSGPAAAMTDHKHAMPASPGGAADTVSNIIAAGLFG